MSFKIPELQASFIPGENTVSDRYTVIKDSATWLLWLLSFTLWLILHFVLKPFQTAYQKLSKQTSGKIQNKPDEENVLKISMLNRLDKFHYMCFPCLFSFSSPFVYNHKRRRWNGEKKLSVGEQMTPQAISIVTMEANLSNALFATSAAESSNSFCRKIDAICQNGDLQMF